jgi:Flp pilus assembly protein TadG
MRPRRRFRRTGSVLIWCALLLPVLVGMVGLVIDGGLMLAAYREAQNAADAAAIAAAYDMMLGKTSATASTTAQTYVTDSSHNNLANATVTVHIPPTVTSYAAYKNSNYAEVIVNYPITTNFMQVLPGFSKNQSVTARAVAGYEAIAGGEGVMALSPSGQGLSLGGNAVVKVNGPAWVNSNSTNAIGFNNSKNQLWASVVQMVESTSQPGQVYNYTTGQPMNANLGQLPEPDYLAYLPTPTTANGVVNTVQTVPKNGGTLQPGIYQGGISLSGGGTYTMQPGIYVMKGGGFSVNGSLTLTGSGVMIYNTGNDYTASTGSPDNTDPIDLLNQSQPSGSGDGFGSFSLNTSITLTPINSATYTYPSSAISAFNGMVFYQRRANTQGVSMTGSGGSSSISGTMYGKWANLNYSGNGSTNAQFVFNTINLTGNGTVTISTVGHSVGSAPQVFLVE